MILPSILSTSHLHLMERLEPLRGIATTIHVDIEDGIFVPNLSFGPMLIKEIHEEFGFELDIHYMVREPQRYIDIFKDVPHSWVSYHFETGFRPDDLSFPKGAKIGVAINPDTWDVPHEVLSRIDFLVIMGVYPGFGGAKFEESTFDLVKRFRSVRDESDYDYDIMVDGGVNKGNIRKLKLSGADHFVAGSGVFSNDPLLSFMELNRICDSDDRDQ
ncbi:MAG: ribulose-phosphate 3-epimerase [Candidatus Methanofastidiosa archaeon]|nr:ribulose-phosphate 3-epimerase [Candidatus Methanofastidiosa archaeon]